MPSVETMPKETRLSTRAATVLDGTALASGVLHGSVSGRIQVLADTVLEVRGVLEDAVVSGPGTVLVSGLLSDVFPGPDCTVLAGVGSVISPADPDGDWLVLQSDGSWSTAADLVFPEVRHGEDASVHLEADLHTWWPLPSC